MISMLLTLVLNHQHFLPVFWERFHIFSFSMGSHFRSSVLASRKRQKAALKVLPSNPSILYANVLLPFLINNNKYNKMLLKANRLIWDNQTALLWHNSAISKFSLNFLSSKRLPGNFCVVNKVCRVSKQASRSQKFFFCLPLLFQRPPLKSRSGNNLLHNLPNNFWEEKN